MIRCCWKKGPNRLTWPKTAEAFAPAKINLSLHVVGRRDDGYHLLDSLVVFVGVGDHLRVTAADSTRLSVSGPLAAGVPTGPDNLVLRAAALFSPEVQARIELTKHLPTASGIGGGSADAAACLRALADLAGRPLPPPDAVLSLGADVPVCLKGLPVRLTGIGETLERWPELPPLWLVLVNPGVSLPTPAVFRGLDRRCNPPMSPPPDRPGVADLLAWLRAQRNDLQDPACEIAPMIRDVLAALADTPHCHLSRMSGSGATCFGVFNDMRSAEAAAERIARDRPDWWCRAAPVLTDLS